MKVTYEEFMKRLNILCDNNWKAFRIMKEHDNEFMNLPKYQQNMFMDNMEVTEVDYVIKLRRE